MDDREVIWRRAYGLPVPEDEEDTTQEKEKSGKDREV
jgi:hypothetical protein